MSNLITIKIQKNNFEILKRCCLFSSKKAIKILIIEFFFILQIKIQNFLNANNQI